MHIKVREKLLLLYYIFRYFFKMHLDHLKQIHYYLLLNCMYLMYAESNVTQLWLHRHKKTYQRRRYRDKFVFWPLKALPFCGVQNPPTPLHALLLYVCYTKTNVFRYIVFFTLSKTITKIREVKNNFKIFFNAVVFFYNVLKHYRERELFNKCCPNQPPATHMPHLRLWKIMLHLLL